jgi:NAD(P)-dependent dehydrogenase (short-subunit alcohol dehydrogenase family)
VNRLQGRVAVITGGASGIGRATALRLAGEGCAIALVDINQARMQETALEVAKQGVVASQHTADVADPERMRALPAEVVAEHGSIHIVVNNAGTSVIKRFEEHTLEDFQWQVGINFWGVIHGCMFFLPQLRKVDEAHIVNVSSMFGFVGVPGQSSYCATKFAVRGFTESLWAELRGTSIGVTSIHPGGIATNIAETVRVADEQAREQLQQSFDQYGHPPEDVAEAILRGITRNKLRVIVGVEAYVVEWLKRLLPVRTHYWFAHRMDPAAARASR